MWGCCFSAAAAAAVVVVVCMDRIRTSTDGISYGVVFSRFVATKALQSSKPTHDSTRKRA